jgi:hypothetical protein
VQTVQHGNPDAPKDHWMNEASTGPEKLSKEELAAKEDQRRRAQLVAVRFSGNRVANGYRSSYVRITSPDMGLAKSPDDQDPIRWCNVALRRVPQLRLTASANITCGD